MTCEDVRFREGVAPIPAVTVACDGNAGRRSVICAGARTPVSFRDPLNAVDPCLAFNVAAGFAGLKASEGSEIVGLGPAMGASPRTVDSDDILLGISAVST